MIVSYKLIKATVLFGRPFAKMARTWQSPGKNPAALYLIDIYVPCRYEVQHPDTPTSWEALELVKVCFNDHNCRIVSSTILMAEYGVNSPSGVMMTHAFISYGYTSQDSR